MTQQDWIPPRNIVHNIFAKLHSISEEENPNLSLYSAMQVLGNYQLTPSLQQPPPFTAGQKKLTG